MRIPKTLPIALLIVSLAPAPAAGQTTEGELAAVCSIEAANPSTAVVGGRVLNTSATALPGAEVELTWTGSETGEPVVAKTQTNVRGLYAFCGVPRFGSIELKTVFLGDSAGRSFSLDAEKGLLLADLVLAESVPVAATSSILVLDTREVPGEGAEVAGRVFGTMSGSPIPGAQVSIAGLEAGTLTDETGRFTLSGLPAGRHTVRVEYLGYGAAEAPIGLEAGRRTGLAVELAPEAIAAEPIEATVTPIVRRRDEARGHQAHRMTADEIEEVPATRATDLVRRMVSGIRVVPNPDTGCPMIFYRGHSTLQNRGYTAPLVVVDGIPSQDTCILDTLDPVEIAEIEVLGVAGAAHHSGGSRAAAGMIRITTKE